MRPETLFYDMGERDDPVVLYRGSATAAGFLKGLLEAGGIEVFLWDEARRTTGTRVVVARRDADRAEPIVKAFLEQGLFHEPWNT